MATTVSEIISQALIFIDDVRLTELLQTSSARFYRKLSQYVETAIPLMNRPPELYTYISKGYVESTYTSASWTSTDESMTEQTVVPTGALNYDLCSVTLRSEDGLYETPYSDFRYDAETGNVTFNIQESAGLEYEIDFYKDGELPDLTLAMKRLMALGVTSVWNDRFNNDWLSMHPKIKDASFDTVNEANYVEKMTIRLGVLKEAFASELHKYEQDVAYNRIIPSVYKLSPTELI